MGNGRLGEQSQRKPIRFRGGRTPTSHVEPSDAGIFITEMDLESSESTSRAGVDGPATRSPVSVILHSPSLRFVFAAALLQNAGLSVVVPSLALQLEDLEAEPTMLGYVAAAAPFVSVVSPTLVGYLTQRCSFAHCFLSPFRVTSLPLEEGGMHGARRVV